MGSAALHPTLIGRRAEQEELAALLADARSGRSRVLVVRGEAGIGKTALLTQMAASADTFQVLHVCGSEMEMEIPYAGVQQLCGPLLTFADQLPRPQRNALEVALGQNDGDSPDPLLVRLATLSLLGAAGSAGATLCVIDDAQWIDTLSLQTLAFVARRLVAESLAMVFATRNFAGAQELRGHPELVLTGLDAQDSRALLASVLPGPLDEHVRDNLLTEAKGNPLALLELHRALTPAELAGGFGLASAADARGLEHGFSRRLGELPRETQMLLLLAAAEPAGRPEWLWASADRLGISLDAALPAEAEGLITVEGGIRFRHPLIRSVVYRTSSLTERKAAHCALAAVITGPSAEDYRAWHRAHAVGPEDDEVADDLERSARRAGARGGAAAAAAFLSRAAALTTEPTTRARRALDAADAKLDAGLPHSALPLLATVEASTDDEMLVARAELVRAKVAFAASRGADAPALLLSAAARLSRLDTALSRETYLQAITAAILVGRCATGPSNSAATVAKTATKAPAALSPARAVDLLLDGLIVRLTEGHRLAAPKLGEAIDAYIDEVNNGTADPRWHDITHRVCLDVFDIDAYNFLAQHQLAQLRSEGALTVLPLALQTSAGIEVSTGNFTKAAMLLDESRVITAATGAPLPGCLWAYLAAYRGQEQRCREIVATTITRAQERGEGFDIDGALYSAAILHLGLSQYPEALAAASSARQHDDLGVQTHVLNEFVEAAARCGEVSIANDAASELREQASVCGTDTGLGMAARATALVNDGPAAEAAYQEAIARLKRSPFVVYLPRAHLVYGEWLRRMKRRAEARAQLRIAHDMFVQMRADGFAHRALRELRATGEPVLNRGHEVVTGLTTQEAQIATLARDGYTNAEIAAQLFISTRTVEWHLNRIFAKLDVTSRRQLRHMNFV
ncbi:AAA family ATPase [Mycobacterium saskatchewanense]|uniref:Transcriptional regulator n=1 Tax=Mycobacterium saskatchewanense TaxID=220927 RepID=A0AAJ3TUR8_9MYCO|nr:AAA family ATPase [Mycobacterium saskatchewanense]ORW71102.1 transcriptional regulator [Mycobacterium saskatchewanense]